MAGPPGARVLKKIMIRSRVDLTDFLRRHRRFGIIGLLFLTMVINSLDRQALSVMAGTLKSTLGFGSVEYSYILIAFLSAYAIGYLFCGRVLDRIGVKLGLALALAVWSLAGMLHAVAAGWVGLALCRFLLGLGESFNSPAGVKAVSEWAPTRERGLSMAVFSNGGVMGAILAPPLVAFLALHLGWRWAFIGTGLLGLVLLLLWWRCYDSPERHRSITEEERSYILAGRNPSNRPPAKPLTMWQLLRHPACVGFFVMRLLTDPTTYFFNFWLPDYLQHARGFTLAMIGLVGWLPFLASDIGGPGGGALSDWLIRRGTPARRARQTLLLAAACAMPLALLAVRVENPWAAIALIAVLLAAQSCWMANQLTLIAESISRENVATLLSLSALGGSLGGIVAMLAAGRVIESAGYVPVFTVIGFLHLTAFGLMTWLTRRPLAT